MNLIQYRRISATINREIEAVLRERGLVVTKVRATVDERGGEIKLSITLRDLMQKDGEGNATNPDRERFKLLARAYGMQPEWLDETFVLGGDEYRVAGLKQRGTKNILIERTSDCSMRIAPPDIVANAFAAAAAKRRAS